MTAAGDDLVVELCLPSDPQYLAMVRSLLTVFAGQIPTLDDRRIGDLKLVVTELFTNAIEANWRVSRTDGRQVQLRCVANAVELVMTVTDSGPGFDAIRDPHPPVEDPSRLEFERGLGIPLIQYLADEVDFVTTDSGTQATVVLRNRG